MKAFLLIERYSISFHEERPGVIKGLRVKPEMKGVMCVAFAESAQEVAKIIGGRYDQIEFDGMLRPIIYLPRDLFFLYSERILQYEKGPVRLFMGDGDVGTYLFIVEVPLLQPSAVPV